VTVRDKNNALVIYSPVGYGVDPASISGTVIYDDFTGDGSTVVFTLSASPSTKNATNVYIDGVYQSKDNYSTSGSTLTFSTAPPLNSAIEVVTQESSIIGGASSQQITYIQGGTDSVTRTVQSRLRDFVSVKDFGAVGDGVTDDTAAIQAAINSAAATNIGKVYFPAGHYIVTTLYDHYDAVNNPDFPNGSYLAGRITLEGAQAVSLPNMLFTTGPYRGTLIQTTSATGPALLLGNGSAAGVDTARRQVVKHMSFLGTCTGAVVEMNAAQQHVTLEHLSIYNKGGANGIGLHVHDGSYLDKFSDLHIASDGTLGTGIKLESGGANLYERVNVTNCGGLAWDVSVGTGNNFISCQARNSLNGMVMNGGMCNTMQGWWFEQNTGGFDLKVRGGATLLTIQGVMFTSTVLSKALLVLGDNTGDAVVDSCRNIQINQCAFQFCGPAGTAGVYKYGTCSDVTLQKCSWKNNGGYGFIINTENGVTPTVVSYPDFYPADAGAPMGDGVKVRDQNGVDSRYLVRGIDALSTLTPVASTVITNAVANVDGLIRITSTGHGLVTGNYVAITNVTGTTEANGFWDILVRDANTFDLVGSTFVNAYVSGGESQKFLLDMRTWTHLPDTIAVNTSSDAYISMPNGAKEIYGKMITLRKTLAGNVLYATAGNISGATSVSATADEESITLLSTQTNAYTRL